METAYSDYPAGDEDRVGRKPLIDRTV